MKLPRPSPEPTVEEIEERLRFWRSRARAHYDDPQLYAAEHDKINDLLYAWQQRKGVR